MIYRNGYSTLYLLICPEDLFKTCRLIEHLRWANVTTVNFRKNVWAKLTQIYEIYFMAEHNSYTKLTVSFPKKPPFSYK